MGGDCSLHSNPVCSTGGQYYSAPMVHNLGAIDSPAPNHSIPSLTAPICHRPAIRPTERPRQLAPAQSANVSCCVLPHYLALANIRREAQSLPAATEDRHRFPLPQIVLGPPPSLALSSVPLLHSHPFGGFGLRRGSRKGRVWRPAEGKCCSSFPSSLVGHAYNCSQTSLPLLL